MKKEIVVYIDESTFYWVDLDSRENIRKNFSSQKLLQSIRLITFQPDLLVNYLGEKVSRYEILDFECLDKQIRQSIGLKGPQDQWNVPNMLSAYLDVEEKTWKYEDRFDLLKLLAACYVKMKELGAGEWQRIEKIEIPVNKILYKAQLNGLYFKNEKIEEKCSDLFRSIYNYKNQIQLDFGFVGDDIESYLHSRKICYHKPVDAEIKYLSREHPELELFQKIAKCKRNLNSLIYLSSVRQDVAKCKPLFKGFGTSTGRVTLRDPAIQNTSKDLRFLLKDDNLSEDYRYVYVDYAQFEAGILAGLTGNKTFQNLYEKDSVYEELQTMSGLPDRDTAKTAFYCFVYGGRIWKDTESFFSKYGLQEFLDARKANAIGQGYVETKLGNRRVICSEADSSWVINHEIQGTSSLIFKQALIDVQQSFGAKVALQIPMHDAALYIVHSSISTESIVDTFKGAFQKWIPKSNPIVKEKDFFDEHRNLQQS